MALEASESERRELEYATQFFDFTPDSFVDTISFSSTDIIDEELNVSQDDFGKRKPFDLLIIELIHG